MIRLHAGTKRPHVYPPTRERDSLVRLSMMLSGNYCTVDLVSLKSISMVNYASTSVHDAGTSTLEAEKSIAFGRSLHGVMQLYRLRRRWHEHGQSGEMQSGVTEGKPPSSPPFLGSAIEAQSGRWRSSLASPCCPMDDNALLDLNRWR